MNNTSSLLSSILIWKGSQILRNHINRAGREMIKGMQVCQEQSEAVSTLGPMRGGQERLLQVGAFV